MRRTVEKNFEDDVDLVNLVSQAFANNQESCYFIGLKVL